MTTGLQGRPPKKGAQDPNAMARQTRTIVGSDTEVGQSEDVEVTKLRRGRPSKAGGKVARPKTMKGVSKVRQATK
jgi:hypothetical protein